MKSRLFKLTVILGIFATSFISCENDEGLKSIIPEKWKINIPSSISTGTTIKSAQANSALDSTDLGGDAIYKNMTHFIAIGEGAADIVQAIMWHVGLFNISEIDNLTYTSDDDNRLKELTIIENGRYDGISYEYALEIVDIASNTSDDKGVAMQVFWNANPTVGIAVLVPYNLDRRGGILVKNTRYSIAYSEAGTANYQSTMEVNITGLPTLGLDEYEVDNLRMFVGKNGNYIDVYGNSNHPNAKTLTSGNAINWAFIASSNENTNVGVAEVGLPSSTINSDDREVLLKDYAMKTVLSNGIKDWFVDNIGIAPTPNQLDFYLQSAAAPGYFSNAGFIQAGTAPNKDYADLASRLDTLSPYNPVDIVNLSVNLASGLNTDINQTTR